MMQGKKVLGCVRLPRVSTSVWSVLFFLSSGASALAQSPPPGVDATEPLRKYPISFLVERPSVNSDPVSLLRLDALHPQDELELKVDPELARNWTFVSATIGAGQKIEVKSWNLWEKKYSSVPVDIGKVPKGDVVPLFFLVLNNHREKKVADAITNALQTSAGQMISLTASFDTIYQQQNRLLNFMSAYAALGPKQAADPVFMKDRIAMIDADLGMPYDPDAPQTQPGILQHGLDAGVGILSTLRETPDNPAATAALAQQQLPSVVSDWVGLVGDLMRIFIKPPHQVKLTFIPASASEIDPTYSKTQTDPEDWMQLMTERVLDTSGAALPTLVFRPNYLAAPTEVKHVLDFPNREILSDGNKVCVPLGPNSRDLFLHPWSWNWEYSEDDQNFTPLTGAQLVPGSGLVFPVSDAVWKGANVKTIYIRANVGFETMQPMQLSIAKSFPQQWATVTPENNDFAVGDHGVTVHLARSGTNQAYYRFSAVSLVDGAGHAIPASSVNYKDNLTATFDLEGIAPGPAKIKVEEENASGQDQPATVFVEPKHPAIGLYCGKGDKEIRVTGPEAGWVKSVKVDALYVTEADDSDPANRRLTFSGTLPDAVKSVDVTYRDPANGLEWTRPVGVSVGLPRPHVTVTLAGTLPPTLPIGDGADPTWVVATLPKGWFPTSQPVRLKLESQKPYDWSHDVRVELGLGAAGDVQTILQFQEGSTFALSKDSADAYVTLNMDTGLPSNSKRTSGLLWFKLTRTELSSPWTLATTQDTPMRGVKVPTVTAVDNQATLTRISLSSADEVLGVRFAGQTDFVEPQLVKSGPSGLIATVDGPVGATEFDLKVRDGGDSLIHVKITRSPAAVAAPSTPSKP